MSSEGNKTSINVQDNFFNHLRKENLLTFIYLLNGRRLAGKVRRFDRYSVVLEIKGKEVLIYKHSIASVATGSEQIEESDSTV